MVYNSTLVIDIPSQLPTWPGVITVSRTARILRHIPEAKSSEITYLAYLIYCFGNCKNKVINLIINPLVDNSTCVIDITSQLPSRRSIISVSRTARILRHITEAKSSALTYLASLIYCFDNRKNKVITSDDESAG